MLADTFLIQESKDPYFLRFYAHMLLTLSRNIVAAESVKNSVSEALDLNVRTNEQTTYKIVKNAVSEGKMMHKAFNLGFLLLAQKLL